MILLAGGNEQKAVWKLPLSLWYLRSILSTLNYISLLLKFQVTKIYLYSIDNVVEIFFSAAMCSLYNQESWFVHESI